MEMFIRALAVVAAAFLCLGCSAERAPSYTFLHSATSAPRVSFYDYIIVGGGTAGCPLAATLSRQHRVLLLERGGSPYSNPKSTQRDSFPGILLDPSATQPFISNDAVINVRARILGGGSSINAGFYSHAQDAFVARENWDRALVKRSYSWVERVVAHKPAVLQWQSTIRDGLLQSGVTPYNNFTYEHSVGTKVGGTIFGPDGRRHSAADLLQYANPKRITVLLHATVHRVIFSRRGGRPAARGVLFRDAASVGHRAYLRKGGRSEVILSAGALSSPQLLMLSGVGPKENLRALGIEVVLDQPMVGQGMKDNPSTGIVVPSTVPVDVSLPTVAGITASGIFVEGGSGPNLLPPMPGTNPLQIGVLIQKLEEPLSSGYLELKSLDPDENPSVTFNYFKQPEDLQRCAEATRLLVRMIGTEVFAPFRYPSLSMKELLNLTATYNLRNLRSRNSETSETMERFCVDTVQSVWHYHGGCQVGRVVDADRRVYGVDGLRVVDGSTFNDSPGTNPQATLMMLGRYMGVKILTERR